MPTRLPNPFSPKWSHPLLAFRCLFILVHCCPVDPSIAPEDLPAGKQGYIAIDDKLIMRLLHPALAGRQASWGAIVFDYHFLSLLAPHGG